MGSLGRAAAASTSATDTTGSVALLQDLHGRIRELEGENQRLTLRVQDLQQQLWGRKAERGLVPAATPALSLFEEALAAESPPTSGLPASRPRAVATSPRGRRPLDPS